MRIHGWPPPPDEDESVIDARDRERCYGEAEPIYWEWREKEIIRRFGEACFQYGVRKRAEAEEARKRAQVERELACPEHRWSLDLDFGEIEIICDLCDMSLFKNEDPKYADIQGYPELLSGKVPITVEIDRSTYGGYEGSYEADIYVNIGWRNHPSVRKYTPEEEERWLRAQQSTA